MQNDDELMRAYQAGSEDAFNQLFTKYSPLVYSFLKRRIRYEEVDDLFQKVWRQLHEKRSLYTDQPFAPWFFVIMRHLVIDEYRSLGRKKDREVKDQLLENIYADNEQIDLDDLLKDLPEESAQLVKRYYLDEVSYQNLELETGLSQSNLRQRLSRAIRSLRKKNDNE